MMVDLKEHKQAFNNAGGHLVSLYPGFFGLSEAAIANAWAREFNIVLLHDGKFTFSKASFETEEDFTAFLLRWA